MTYAVLNCVMDRIPQAIAGQGSAAGVETAKLSFLPAASHLGAMGAFWPDLHNRRLKMRPAKVTGFLGLFAALLLAACATAPAPTANLQTYVAQVEVVQPAAPAHGGARSAAATNAFAIILRQAVVSEAALYGEAGKPITLQIALSRVHYKNALQALIIGDDNQAKGQVSVIDPATGQTLSSFPVQVNAEKAGQFGTMLAMSLVGAFDPTGLVDLGGSVAQAGSADINRSGTAGAMGANFAIETLRQTFGDVRAKAVAKARRVGVKAR